MEKKEVEMTKAEMFLEAAMVLSDTNGTGNYTKIIKMLEEEAVRVTSRNAARRKIETKEQKLNRRISADVFKFFDEEAENDIAYTLEEIGLAVGFEGTSQKMSAILRFADSVNFEKTDKATSNKARIGYKKV